METATIIDETFQTAAEPREHARVTVRTAYLLSRYPAVSHTFFLKEVLGLRDRGMHIETASINGPDRPLESLPEDEAAEAQTTFYLKRRSAIVPLVLHCVAHPLVLLRGLRAVCQVPRLRLRERIYWLLYLAEAILLGAWMRERNLQHLHVHFGGAVASVGMLAAEAWNLPWSLTIHGPEELLNTDSYCLPQKIRSARFVFCISDFCRSQLCRLLPADEWGKLHVLRLGVQVAKLKGARKEVVRRNLRLVCTGRLVPEKGHRILLEALLLLRARGIHLDTTLIGSGPELAALQAFTAEHKLTGTVTFTGSLAHAATLDQVRGADLFALASFAEGIPVALMEAMAMSVPCVSTAIAGIPELIESGVDGVLVPPANPEALACALGRLAEDRDSRQRMGDSARERIARQYDLAANLDLLADAFARESQG